MNTTRAVSDTKQVKDAWINLIGKKQVANDLVRRLFSFAHKMDYGIFYEPYGSVIHANSKDCITNTRMMRSEMVLAKQQGESPEFWTDKDTGHKWFGAKGLTQKRIHQHLIATSKSDYLWYCNYGLVENDRLLVMVMFDSDWHKELIAQYGYASDTFRIVELLSKKLGSVYSEPSTNGQGHHSYAVLSFDKYTPYRAVNSFLNSLAKIISTEVKSLGIVSDCNEIKGTLPISEGINVVMSGSMAKMPRPKSIQDCQSLLSLIPVTAESLGFNLEEHNGRQAEKTAILVSTDASSVRESILVSTDTSPNTFDRTNNAVVQFRKSYPHCTFEQCWEWYTSNRWDIGNSDKACLEDAFIYSRTHYNPKPTGWTKEQSESLIASLCLEERHLAYGAKEGKSGYHKLKIETLVEVLSVWTNILLVPHEDSKMAGTVAQAYMKSKCKINNDQWQSAKRLFLEREIFAVLDNSYFIGGKNGRSKKYGFGKNHPKGAK